jgi:anhydro-N-acetylmuramic acid kinase
VPLPLIYQSMTLKTTIAGVMSGTSLDGLDIAICTYEKDERRWSFEVLAAITLPYSDEWRNRLSSAFTMNGNDLMRLHADFGTYIGQCVKQCCIENHVKPDYISSHGHTVFHQPSLNYTFQVGSGASIAVASGFDTICDFRSTDVALHGQGAPLVPIGDHHLFGGHRFCLNLGGFANISFEKNDERIAFDICPVNIALNYLAEKLGYHYDEGGNLAAEGQILPGLLDKLNALSFYEIKPPKSLGREWFEKEFLPLINGTGNSIKDILRTVVQHIAIQISNVLFLCPGTTIFTTGGGAYNNLLIEAIEEQVSRHGIHVVVPETTIVNFKEAIIFGFLGALRINRMPNALKSVTGAIRDNSGGCIYLSGS